MHQLFTFLFTYACTSEVDKIALLTDVGAASVCTAAGCGCPTMLETITGVKVNVSAAVVVICIVK